MLGATNTNFKDEIGISFSYLFLYLSVLHTSVLCRIDK